MNYYRTGQHWWRSARQPCGGGPPAGDPRGSLPHSEALSICASTMTSGYKAADLQLCLRICCAIRIMLRRCCVHVAQLLLLNVLKPFLLAERPIADQIMPDPALQLLNVTPAIGPSVFQPKYRCGRIRRLPVPADCELIETALNRPGPRPTTLQAGPPLPPRRLVTRNIHRQWRIHHPPYSTLSN
jgi:hypothetical protein